MSIFQSLFMGFIQGITEFLPISSSGHLVIIPRIFGWEEQSLFFDTTLHLATGLALVVSFWKDIVSIFKSFIKDVFKNKNSLNHYSSESLLGIKIIVACIPVGLIGYFFGDIIENNFRNILFVSIFLIFGSVLMFIAERRIKKTMIVKDEISIGKSFNVGLFQIFSLLPGVSRSGSTISGGMIFGLSREEATRFSFLLSIPVVLLAGVLKLVTSISDFSYTDFSPILFGFLSSFVVGIFAIKFMLRFVRTNKLYPFIIYRMSLAVLLLILVII